MVRYHVADQMDDQQWGCRMSTTVDIERIMTRLEKAGDAAPPAADPMVWWPVGKDDPLPEGYTPPDLVSLDRQKVPTTRPALLREIVVPDLANLLVAAAMHGHEYKVVSAFRSAEYQQEVFARFVERELQQGALDELQAISRANRYSALPGYSEHQLGTTVDLSIAALDYRLTPDLGATPEGIGLADNAWRYGFLLSYPNGSEPRSGYVYEPWHLRWLGRPLAAALHAEGYMRTGEWDTSQPTLEEWLVALAIAGR